MKLIISILLIASVFYIAYGEEISDNIQEREDRKLIAIYYGEEKAYSLHKDLVSGYAITALAKDIHNDLVLQRKSMEKMQGGLKWFDDSGFVNYVYEDVLGVPEPSTPLAYEVNKFTFDEEKELEDEAMEAILEVEKLHDARFNLENEYK